MPTHASNPPAERHDASPRKAWVAPAVADLPRLKDLTLQTGFAAADSRDSGFTFS